MIRHIVLFKLFDGVTREDPRAAVAFDTLAKLGGVIPELRFWQVGWNISDRDIANDVALIADVNDAGALQRYIAHPEHQAVLPLLREVSSWVVVDLEI